MKQQGKQKPRKKWRGIGLQARMTLSYLVSSVLGLLLLESLFFTTIFVFVVPYIQSHASSSISRATATATVQVSSTPTHVVEGTPGSKQDGQGQIPSNLPTIPGILGFVLLSGLFWLVVLSPAGALFGFLFTRGLIRRIRGLILATAQFASGDYTRRVMLTRRDEIGQLEQQFNDMAEQLVGSIQKQQELVEYNARMEERARIEQEMQTARLIQLSLLPKALPEVAGWQITTHYQPAREVGGDLYDFIPFYDGRLGIVIGDVTDKGVAAAIVMASTRSMLRAAAQALTSPGEVLARVNELLYTDTPARMFVTCFYAILDPRSGNLWYANAGHDLPYQRADGKVEELLATGMPLGLLPGMQYEEREMSITQGECLLFYSDGLVEAHNGQQEMFGFPRLKLLLTRQNDQDTLIPFLLDELKNFTGSDWEQEDDITLITVQRMPATDMKKPSKQYRPEEAFFTWSVASQQGNEKEAMERVGDALTPLGLPAERLANLKTAVAEGVMNAMEHGNQYDPEKAVMLQVYVSERTIIVRILDQGEGEALPDLDTIDTPDLTAKLAGLQTPRGWGLFLIKSLVDELHITREEKHQVIELVMARQIKPECE